MKADDFPMSGRALERAVPGIPLPGKEIEVLHVDDDEDDRVIFCRAAQRTGFPFRWQSVRCAEDGMTYLRTLLTTASGGTVRFPDLVILDVMMPGGSGLSLLQFIRATPELKPVVAVILSGDLNPIWTERAREMGADAFLDKPVSYQEMVKMLGALYKFCAARRAAADG